jgi:hypothetical protein
MATNSRTRPEKPRKEAALRLSRVNFILLVAGAAVASLGWYMLAQGSTVAAPLLLVLGYVALIPLGIIK